MQFHLNGYDTGDPLVEDPHPSVAGRPTASRRRPTCSSSAAGPAGLVLAAQLARFPEITTVIVDRSDGPLEVGQADGVACRTVEMFEAFGLADRLLREAYWVNETAFWRPDADGSRPDRPHRPRPGHRGRPVGVPARHRQPGADARLPARVHGALAVPADPVLRPRTRPASRSTATSR